MFNTSCTRVNLYYTIRALLESKFKGSYLRFQRIEFMLYRLLIILVLVVLNSNYLNHSQQLKGRELRHTTSSNVENLQDTCTVVPNR